MSTQTTSQTWGQLRKAWKAYKIAKVQHDREGMKKYSEQIRTLQTTLGVPQSTFVIPEPEPKSIIPDMSKPHAFITGGLTCGGCGKGKSAKFRNGDYRHTDYPSSNDKQDSSKVI